MVTSCVTLDIEGLIVGEEGLKSPFPRPSMSLEFQPQHMTSPFSIVAHT
jgi:hypothetical protein